MAQITAKATSTTPGQNALVLICQIPIRRKSAETTQAITGEIELLFIEYSPSRNSREPLELLVLQALWDRLQKLQDKSHQSLQRTYAFGTAKQ
jgi:hypothetical protein